MYSPSTVPYSIMQPSNYHPNMPQPPYQGGGYPVPQVSPPHPGPAVSPTPTAPSISDMQKIQGYENLTFEDAIITPPVAPDWHQDPPMRQDITNLPYWSEEEVRGAVNEFVASNCCYGKGVARDMTIDQTDMHNAFHYTLETFGEKRESAWSFEPYEGQVIDGSMNGPAPGPWDLAVFPNSNFVDSKMKVEVPHTAFIKPCHTCVGNGRVRCNSCSGLGRSPCTWCNGSGRRDSGSCTTCNGMGYRMCMMCDATGQMRCRTCNGRCTLKGFVQLTVTWANHCEEYISDTARFPKEKVREATGNTVFEEENPRVWPITRSGDVRVDAASNDLVNKHDQQFKYERILKQRHCLRVIPVAEVTYRWKEKPGQFYVYGFENKVYFKNYPQRCCWCCNIL